ncbi:MAG: branched-chain amino acid ABC transporter permease [Ignavibacteriales bacterium]
MIVTILNVIIGGLIMGGIYALISVGLSMQYGVARVLNVSHGEFIILGAFITWTLYTRFSVNPVVSLVVLGPALFVAGFGLHRTLFKRLRSVSPSAAAFEGNSMLMAFGILFIIQNVAIITWGSTIRSYTFLAYAVDIGGLRFSANRLLILLFAVASCLAFYLFLAHTRLGKAIRASAQDPVAAGLLGVNIDSMLAICFGLGALMAGIAGGLQSVAYQIQATMGLQYTVIAIIVVVLGGLGSIPGSLAGGFLLGLIGSIVSTMAPSLTLVAYYVLFMVLLLVKPTGIFGKP